MSINNNITYRSKSYQIPNDRVYLLKIAHIKRASSHVRFVTNICAISSPLQSRNVLIQ